MRAVDQVLRVFERNPNMEEMLLRAREPPLRLIYWGSTRWNSKVDAMERVYTLHESINYVMQRQPAQAGYKLLEEEVQKFRRQIDMLFQWEFFSLGCTPVIAYSVRVTVPCHR